MEPLALLRSKYAEAKMRGGESTTEIVIVGAKVTLTESFVQYAVPRAIQAMMQIPTGSASMLIMDPDKRKQIRINVLLGSCINNDGTCNHFLANQKKYGMEYMQFIG